MHKIIKLASACLLITLLASCNKGLKSTKGYTECTTTTDNKVCMAWSNTSCTKVMVAGLVKKIMKMDKPPKPCNIVTDYAALIKKGITTDQINKLKKQATKIAKQLT